VRFNLPNPPFIQKKNQHFFFHRAKPNDTTLGDKKKSFFSQELLHFHQTLLQKGSGDCWEKKNTQVVASHTINLS